MPNVHYKHRDYTKNRPDWVRIRDCLGKQSAIKREKTTYLPMPNAADQSPANLARYDSYLDRAVFFDATSRTHGGLIGEVFSIPPVMTLPASLKPYVDNIDGEGVTLDQQSKRAVGLGLAYGRCGLLADYPANLGEDGQPRVATKAELTEGNVRPLVKLYTCFDIINWGTKAFGARVLVNLVVLEEEWDEDGGDGFEPSKSKRFRVLRLASDQTYFVEIWTENADGSAFEMTDSFVPTMANGERFNYIPFHFIGSVDNSSTVDPAPILGLADMNLAHYRNSADYEWSTYQVGMPTAWMSGLTQEWADKHFPKGVQMGCNNVLLLPVNGSFGIEQPDPNTMAAGAMEHKEKLMVALGAKLVENRTVERTAYEAGMDKATETSVLGVVAQNVSFAYQAALVDAGRFVDAGLKKVEFDINTDFDIVRLTPQERAQTVAEYQQGILAYSEVRQQLRDSGFATLTDDEAKDEIEQDPNRLPPVDPNAPKEDDTEE